MQPDANEAVCHDAVEQNRALFVLNVAVSHQHSQIAHIDQHPQQLQIFGKSGVGDDQRQPEDQVEQREVAQIEAQSEVSAIA